MIQTKFIKSLILYTVISSGFLYPGVLKNTIEDLLELSSTHPLPLFNIFFHVLSNSSSEARRLLIQSNVLCLIMNEVEALTILPKLHKVLELR